MRAPSPLVRSAVAVLVAATLVLSGCASTQEATSERDAEAKRFLLRDPEGAAIYVYRDDFAPVGQDEVQAPLYLDTRLIGTPVGRTFFRIDVQPGAYVLRGIAQDTGRLTVEARRGEISFVMLRVRDGQSRFTAVSAETGERDIRRCCTLVENADPDRRIPFLGR